MLFGPTAFYEVLTRVRDANRAALQVYSSVPERVSIVPGAIAWDECDRCGLLALASARHFLSDQFPMETTVTTAGQGSPGALLCADMVVQIIRCAPAPQGHDVAPSVEALDASAQEVIADAYAVLCSTLETLQELLAADDIVDFLIRSQTFVGPAGMCVGSELAFAVGVIR